MHFFLENPLELTDVNHVDGNPSNNNLDNLEWISHSDNLKHALKIKDRNYSNKFEDRVKIVKGKTKTSYSLNLNSKHLGRFDTLDAAKVAYKTALERSI